MMAGIVSKVTKYDKDNVTCNLFLSQAFIYLWLLENTSSLASLVSGPGDPGGVLVTLAGFGDGDCFKGGDHHICLPGDYSKYDLPTFTESVLVTIEVHIKDIPKVG